MTSVISPVFNRMLSASVIEEVVTASLKKWFPTYLRELERQMNLPVATFEPPNNYSDRNAFEIEPPEELPKVVVIAAGTLGAPIKTGSGQYSAMWRLGIGIAVGAKTEVRSNMLMKGYAAAIRGIMLQSSELDSVGAIDIVWTDESYDTLPIPDIVQLVKAASLYFNIEINDVVTRGPGPDEPDQTANDYVYGEVETVEIDLEKVQTIH